MKPVMLLLLGSLLLTVCACEEAGFVDKDKYDKVVQENADLKKQLAQKEEELKNIPRHHYSFAKSSDDAVYFSIPLLFAPVVSLGQHSPAQPCRICPYRQIRPLHRHKQSTAKNREVTT